MDNKNGMEIPKKSPFFPTLIPENSVGEIYHISHINYGFIMQNVTSANRIIYVNSKDTADICIILSSFYSHLQPL